MTTRTVERIYNGVAGSAAALLLGALIGLARVGDVAAACIVLLVLCVVLWAWLDTTQTRRRRRRDARQRVARWAAFEAGLRYPYGRRVPPDEQKVLE